MKKAIVILVVVLAIAGAAFFLSQQSNDAPETEAPQRENEAKVKTLAANNNKSFKLCWSRYIGWEPWGYAQEFGIVDKWAKQYGINISVEMTGQYLQAVNGFASGTYQGCSFTSMDALSIPASNNVDTSAIIVAHYSNGNDGIIIKQGSTVSDLKNKPVYLVKNSVSDYLLGRALDEHDIKRSELDLRNISDLRVVNAFAKEEDVAAVTWNPQLQEILNSSDSKIVFDSSQIPGEILDVIVVNKHADDRFKRAITAIWYESMQILATPGEKRQEMLSYIAEQNNTNIDDIEYQLGKTKMFYSPEDALQFMQQSRFKRLIKYARSFSFTQGLFGSDADTINFIGIQFSDGSVLGDEKNIKLVFKGTYMKLADEQQL